MRNDSLADLPEFFDELELKGNGDLDWEFVDSLSIAQKRHLWRLHLTNKIKIISTGLLLKLKKVMEEHQ